MNLQVRVVDIDALDARVQRSRLRLVIPLEERWYRQNRIELGQRRFVVDPDGSLRRFFGDLGTRPFQGDLS